MRGSAQQQDMMFSYLSPEARVPKDYPLRPIRKKTNTALQEFSPLFEKLYSHTGRPSIPSEHLLRAFLLQVLHSIRSERLLIEQFDNNCLCRWFISLSMDDPVCDSSTLSTNRERPVASDVAEAFLCRPMFSEWSSGKYTRFLPFSRSE